MAGGNGRARLCRRGRRRVLWNASEGRPEAGGRGAPEMSRLPARRDTSPADSLAGLVSVCRVLRAGDQAAPRANGTRVPFP
jgi:hypothetical protein